MTDAWRSAYRGRRVLVTGATGFIGRHVATALLESGAHVLSVSRSAGGPDAPPGETVVADLAVPGSARELVAEFAPAVTFNLAGYGVDPAERDADVAGRLNTALPAELAAACGEGGDPGWRGQHLVHAGSALEYGSAGGDLREATVERPTTLYGTTKADGTRRLIAIAEERGIRATVARLFTVYGAGERPGRLLPTLIRGAHGSDPIPLSAGAQRRDFTWVGDAVEGLLRLGALGSAGAGIVNLATGRLTSVREFVGRAAAVLGIAPSRLAFGALPTRGEEMSHDDVAVARLEGLTGWRPSTTIEDGVRRTVAAA